MSETMAPTRRSRVSRKSAAEATDTYRDEPDPVQRRVSGEKPEDFIDPETGEPLRRRSRGRGGDNVFDIPPRLRRDGWDYQWFTMRVLGENVDPSSMVDIADGGWRAVKPADMPGYMPGGYEGKTIDRKGQRLYTRPMRFTIEAKVEDEARAREARQQKFRQAEIHDPSGNRGQAPRTLAKLHSEYGPAVPGGVELPPEEFQEV